jgi:prolyl-tRNA editing enzyme YbaK/EbsC (Cys-tRNA(Pro) deacylase)
MKSESSATRAIDEHNIQYRLHVHSGPLKSVEQAAHERGLIPDQIVRSLVFRLPGGEFIMVLAPGTNRIAWPKLRAYLEVSRITTARPEELVEVTGYEQGTISPFGLPQKMRILADHGILQHDVISLGAGIKNSGIIMNRRDLESALELEWGDFAG